MLRDTPFIVRIDDTRRAKKCIVNKWHVFVKLSMNKELIQFRHHNIKSRKAASVETESPFRRILNLAFTILD